MRGCGTLRSFQNSCATAAMMCGSSLHRFSASVDLDLRCGRGARAMASALSTPEVGHSCVRRHQWMGLASNASAMLLSNAHESWQCGTRH